MSTTLTQTQISQLYVSIFNRASEGLGNQNWQNQGWSMADTATEMLNTGDAKEYFGTSLDSNQAFIEHIYLNTLNKTPADDATGIANWVAQLDSHSMTKGEVVASMIEAINTYAPNGANYNPSDTKTNEAYQQFENRVTVSNHMANTIQNTPADYKTSTVFDQGLPVTADLQTVTNSTNIIDNMTAVTGDTIVVTGGGLFNGTVDSDTFLASRGEIDSAVIQAKEGNDTLKATIDNGHDDGATLTTYDLENIMLRNTDGITTIDLLEANGLKEVWNDRSAGTELKLKNVSTDVTVGVKDTASKTTIEYANVSGSSDAVTVKLDGAKDGASLVATGVETLNLDVTSDSYLDVSGNDGLKSVNISGNSATSIKVDGTKDITITGGEGEDTLLLSGTLGDNLEMSSIEKLAVSATTTLDLDKVNVDEIISLDGNLTVTNVEKEILVISDSTKSIDATVKTGTDTVFVDVKESANGTATTLILDSNTKALSLSGDGIAKFTNELTVETIDASTNTAGVNLTLGASNQTITGTAQADTFNMGANSTADDTIDGGAGEDIISFSISNDTVSSVTSNIETALVNFTADKTFDAVNLADTTLIKTTGTGTLSNLSAGTDVEINDDASLAISLKSDTGTSDSLDVSLSNDGNQTVTTLTANGIETLNLSVVDSGATTDTTTITTLTATSLTSLNLSSNEGKVTITNALTNTADMNITLSSGLDSEFTLSTSDVAETIKFDGAVVGDVKITSFNGGIGDTADVLDFSIYGVASSNDLHITDNGDDTTIDIVGDTNFGSVTLMGVVASDLDSSANFHFA